MLRIVHTADWHLGHTLHDHARTHEHQQFLDWLVQQLLAYRADGLLIAGDVFDSANPPTAALELWYRFLAELQRVCPHVQTVVIGGNHDSPARLNAPSPLLRGHRVTIVGGVPRVGRGHNVDANAMLVPLHQQGQVAAWVVAMPFVRIADVPAADAFGFAQSIKVLYDEVLSVARVRREPGQALIAMGHLHLVGTTPSQLSERRILGGGEEALCHRLFPQDVSYVALGHLHMAQRVAGEERIRYPGSPIPLSLWESRYRHQILVVDLDGDRCANVETVAIPRTVRFLRLPARGSAPLHDICAALGELDERGNVGEATRPYLEISVSADRPIIDLREQIEAALVGQKLRLCKIGVEYTGTQASLGDTAPQQSLADLTPHEVFLSRYRADHAGPPPPELMAAFAEILDEVQA